MNQTPIAKIIAAINWVWFVITLLVFSLLIKLGMWQSDRAQEKTERLAKIDALKTQPHFSLTQLESIPEQDVNDLPVKMSAAFDSKRVLLLDNQTHNGQVGYRVLQMVRAPMTESHVLVNLGWVAGSKNRNVLPNIEPVDGNHEIRGHVRIVDNPIQLAEQTLNKEEWPLRIQAVDIGKLQQVFDEKLLPFVIYLDKKDNLGFVKNWQPIVMPPEKHRGYAFQWFSLATAWMLLMLWALIKNYKKGENHDNAH